MGEKAKNSKGRSKSYKDLPPLPSSNTSNSSSPSCYEFQKKSVPPSPSSEQSSKNGNNRSAPLDVFHKYLKMIKPLCERFSSKSDQGTFSGHLRVDKCVSVSAVEKRNEEGSKKKCSIRSSHHFWFSENSKKVKKSFGFSSHSASMVSSPKHSGVLSGKSYPSSMRSSPTHSGALNGMHSSTISSMEELQSAVQAAIAHCKNSNSITSDLQESERF